LQRHDARVAVADLEGDGVRGKGLDGVGISGTKPVLLGLSVEAIIDETPQWMTATGGKSVSGAGGPASSSTNLN